MSGFSLHALENESVLDTYAGDPAQRDLDVAAPKSLLTTYGETVDSAGRGMLESLISVKMAANRATAWLPDSFFEDDDAPPMAPLTERERQYGVITADRSGRENNGALANQIQELRQDQQSVGILGQITYGLASTLPQATVGSLVGGPLGAGALLGTTTGTAEYEVGMANGLDSSTALGSGLITGGFNALGAGLPGSVGKGILARVGSGVALNVPLGVAQRYSTSAWLSQNGYEDMAEQYRAFDGGEMLVDAVLGAAFGALPNGHSVEPRKDTGNGAPPTPEAPVTPPPAGEAPPAGTEAATPPPAGTAPARPIILPSDIDLSLSANGMTQFEVDAAPGIPTDAKTRAAHVKSMDTAYRQLMNDEPVNLQGSPLEGELLAKPMRPDAAESLGAALEEGGYAELMREANALREDAARRGIPLGEELNDPLPDVAARDSVQTAAYMEDATPAARPYVAEAEQIVRLFRDAKAAEERIRNVNMRFSQSVQAAAGLATRPVPLMEFIKSVGGIRSGITAEEAANLRRSRKRLADYYTGGLKDLFDGNPRGLSQYVRHNGLSMEDELPNLAGEAGYLGDEYISGEYRRLHPEATQQRFLEVLQQGIKGEKIYTADVMRAVDDAMAKAREEQGLGDVRAMDAYYEDFARHNVDPENPTVPEVARMLAEQDEARAAKADTFPGDTPPSRFAEDYSDDIPFMRADTKDEAFKHWFGASKVVDAAGNPLVVYHGTNAMFEAFDPAKGGANGSAEGYGFYFTDEKATAEGYAKIGGDGRVIEAYMSMQKPLDVNAPKFTAAQLQKVIKKAVELEIKQFPDEMSDYKDTFLSNFVDTYSTPLDKAVAETARMLVDGNEIAVDQLAELSNVSGSRLTVARAVRDTLGYDGIMAKGYGGRGEAGGNIYVAWFPEQIKSIYNAGTYDPNDPRIMFMRATTEPADASDVNPLGFYSQLARVADAKLPGRGAGADFIKALDAYAKSGDFKPEELEYSGVKEWLSTQEKVSKAEVLNFLRDGGVTLREVTLRETADAPPRMTPEQAIEVIMERQNLTREQVVDEQYGYTNPDDYVSLAESLMEDDLAAAMEGPPADGKPKYARYAMPAGENYREVLLTLPANPDVVYTMENVTPSDPSLVAPNLAERFWYFDAPDNVYQIAKSKYPNQEDARAYVIREKQPQPPASKTYASSHWQQKNVLAHFRLADHVDDAGQRVLLIEEIQSDWHQEGRRKGYGEKKGFSVYDGQGYLVGNSPDRAGAERMMNDGTQRYPEQGPYEIRQDQVIGAGVPDAPFKKTWAELSFKRILRMAAEQGYAKVAWTTGEIQADRFGLSKHIGKVQWSEDTKTLTAWNPDQSKTVLQESNVTADKLEDYVGKEVAQKLVAQEADDDGDRMLAGLDLKVGGEGMKGFYDDILPKMVGKVVGKLDKAVKVGNVKISAAYKEQAEDAALLSELLDEPVKMKESHTVHGFDMTPELRARVLEGLPQFYRSGAMGMPEGLEQIARGLAGEKATNLSPDDLMVASAVNQTVAQMLPLAETRMARRLYSTGDAGAAGEVYGAFRRPLNVRESRGVIDWALAAPDAVGVARHEVIHGLKEAGLFKPVEWDALVRAAEEGRWVQKHKVSDQYRPEQRTEEAIAEEFRNWRRGKPEERAKTVSGIVYRALARLDLTLRRVADMARRLMGTMPTADDVFSRVESGEVGNRAPMTQAEQVLADKKVILPDDDGSLVDGELAMIDADAEAFRAEQFGPLHEVAVGCHLRG